MKDQKYLKTKDVAKMFNVSRQSIYEWRQAGMPFIGSGNLMFYIEEEIVEWIKNRNSAPKVKAAIDESDKIKEVIESNYPK